MRRTIKDLEAAVERLEKEVAELKRQAAGRSVHEHHYHYYPQPVIQPARSPFWHDNPPIITCGGKTANAASYSYRMNASDPNALVTFTAD